MLRTDRVAYGTGLIALDAVYGLNGEVPRLHAGGTCGNVMAALAFLGWKSFPIGRLGDDAPARAVASDLVRWGVSTDLLSVTPTAPTPIVIEQIIRTKKGHLTHRFHFNCPKCGGYLPSFRPLREDSANAVQPRLKPAAVFFADRVSAGIVRLAEHFRKRDTVIVFEPCGTGDEKQFCRMIQLADIVKYSHERAKGFYEILQSACPPLQIETLGEAGLHFRSRLRQRTSNVWVRMDAFEPKRFKDAAGSGDWCTVGLIDKLCRHGRKHFLKSSETHLRDSLRFAQATASWNCAFEGARGGMYFHTRSSFEKEVARILKRGIPQDLVDAEPTLATGGIPLCKDCHHLHGKPVASTTRRLAVAASSGP